MRLFAFFALVSACCVITISSKTKSAPIRVVNNPAAGKVGNLPFSQAVIADKTVYMSGQIGLDPKTEKLAGKGDVKAEARQALTNMEKILEGANCTFKNVVKTTVLLKDIKDYGDVNEVYASFFTPHYYPARAAYQVGDLPLGAKVEIEAIAVIGHNEKD